MRRTFNCGVGMIVVVEPDDVAVAIRLLEKSGERAWPMGTLTAGAGPVVYR